MKNTLCIVGSHPRTREQMDFGRTDCDIWVFNEAMSNAWVKRADAVFQMHKEAIWRNPLNRNDPKHYEWLQNTDIPVYMQDVYPDVPKSVRYPLDEVIAKLLPNAHLNNEQLKFFNSSVDYAIALGVYQGYKRIEIYGVELETGTEYFYQQTGFSFWTGIAIGRGVETYQHAAMFKKPLYGYEGEAFLPNDTFSTRLEELTPIRDNLLSQYQKQVEASREAFEAFLKDATRPNAEKFMSLLEAQRSLGQHLSAIDGAMQENEKYAKKAEAMKEQAGEFWFSRQEFEGATNDLQKQSVSANVESNVLGGRCEVLFTAIMKTQKEKLRRKKAMEFTVNLAQHMERLFYSALFAGAAKENHEYLGKLDALIKAAGGSKSEAVLIDEMRRNAVE